MHLSNAQVIGKQAPWVCACCHFYYGPSQLDLIFTLRSGAYLEHRRGKPGKDLVPVIFSAHPNLTIQSRNDYSSTALIIAERRIYQSLILTRYLEYKFLGCRDLTYLPDVRIRATRVRSREDPDCIHMRSHDTAARHVG